MLIKAYFSPMSPQIDQLRPSDFVHLLVPAIVSNSFGIEPSKLYVLIMSPNDRSPYSCMVSTENPSFAFTCTCY